MSGWSELHLSPALGSALETLGYGPDQPEVREAAPCAARGNNLVLAWPPAAVYAAPAIAGLLSPVQPGTGRVLVLAPTHALAEWQAVLDPLAHAAGLRLHLVHGTARAGRRLRDGLVDIILADPDRALDLHRRSALKLEEVTQVLLAWPDLLDGDDALALLMQDVPRDATRILQLARTDLRSSLIERYARRAVVSGALAQPAPEGESPAVQIAVTPWGLRPAALCGVLETLDPATAVVWAADARSAEEARAALPSGAPEVTVTSGNSPTTSLVIAWDLPTPARLRQLASAGPVVLLAPVHAAPYLESCTSARRALRLPGALDSVQAELSARRASIATAIDQGQGEAGLLPLAPLFDRYDPALIAGALYQLWREQSSVSVSPPTSEVKGTARVWVGLGKKDEASANDFVAALTRELGVDREKIGKIDLRELYSLIELPAEICEEVGRRLNGITIRHKRIVARVDRGTPARGPGGRGRPTTK
jgi:ATP-dependent RNA helicase DeaD